VSDRLSRTRAGNARQAYLDGELCGAFPNGIKPGAGKQLDAASTSCVSCGATHRSNGANGVRCCMEGRWGRERSEEESMIIALYIAAALIMVVGSLYMTWRSRDFFASFWQARSAYHPALCSIFIDGCLGASIGERFC
jgi:hypothetical protein